MSILEKHLQHRFAGQLTDDAGLSPALRSLRFAITAFELNADFFQGHEGLPFELATHAETEADLGLRVFAYCPDAQQHLAWPIARKKSPANAPTPAPQQIVSFCISDLLDNQADGVDPMRSVRPVFTSISAFLNRAVIQK